MKQSSEHKNFSRRFYLQWSKYSLLGIILSISLSEFITAFSDIPFLGTTEIISAVWTVTLGLAIRRSFRR